MTVPNLGPLDIISEAWVDAVADALNAGDSNADGRWAMLSDGQMVCWFIGSRSLAINTAYGSLFLGTLTFTFPKAFAAEPVVAPAQCRLWDTGASWAALNSSNATSCTISYLDAFTRAAKATKVGYIAIGAPA